MTVRVVKVKRRKRCGPLKEAREEVKAEVRQWLVVGREKERG